jgi:hypothetical protein
MQSTSSLLSLPREIVYIIVGVNVSTYNALTRTCKALSSAYTPSALLTFMLAAELYMEICTSLSDVIIRGMRMPYSESHDIIVSTIPRITGDRGYRHNGLFHRTGGPAYIRSDEFVDIAQWYQHGELHRDSNEPSGTGVDLLRGVAMIEIYADGAMVCASWYTNGVMKKQLTSPQHESIMRAEIAYWRGK